MNRIGHTSPLELCPYEEPLPVAARPSPFSVAHRARRAVWGAVWLLLFRPSPKVFHGWRRFLLRVFGARIGHGARPYPGARVWAP